MNDLFTPVAGPTIRRGQSNQVVGTPQAFVEECEKHFGPIVFDLAASPENAKRPQYFTKEQNSLVQDWAAALNGGIGWLNPEYSNIGQWAKKCDAEAQRGARVLMLVPASVGSNWYRDYVFRRAQSIFLNGRIRFVGEKYAYPKDLMLCGFGMGQGFEIWTPPKTCLK